MDAATPTRSRTRRRRARVVAGCWSRSSWSWSHSAVGSRSASCSGGDDADSAKPTTTTAAATTKLDIPLGDVTADSAGAPVTIAADQSQHVLDALTTYVKGATVQPLRTGKPATADFGGVFDAATLATATTADRGVLLDEGLPQVTGDLQATAQPVTLVGLGDQGGNLTLITAALVVDVTGATKVKDGAAPHRPPGRFRAPTRPDRHVEDHRVRRRRGP